MIYDCIIVGGGAAGMCAAITLARSNKQVLLIEQCKELGKKLSVTGNGRCNFTNSYYGGDCYRGDPSFPFLEVSGSWIRSGTGIIIRIRIRRALL